MTPIIERTAKPKRNRISIQVPDEFSDCTYRIVMIPIDEPQRPKYDFSRFEGKLSWKGDEIAEQRRLRDEW